MLQFPLSTSFVEAFARALSFYVVVASSKGSQTHSVSPVVLLFLVLVTCALAALVMGAGSAWDPASMQHAAAGALAPVAFFALDDAVLGGLSAALSVFLQLAERLAGPGSSTAQMQAAAQAAGALASPLFAGLLVHFLTTRLFPKARGVVGVTPALLAGLAAASAPGLGGLAPVLGPLLAVQTNLALAVFALVGLHAALTPSPSPAASSLLPGMSAADLVSADGAIAVCALAAVLSWTTAADLGSPAGAAFAAVSAALVVAALCSLFLHRLRALAPAFAAEAAANGAGLTLTSALFAVVLLLAVRASGVPSSPFAGPGAVRALLSFSVGAAVSSLSFAAHNTLMEPLQLYSAAAYRASTLDYCSLQALLVASGFVILTQSSRPAEAARLIASLATSKGADALPALLAKHAVVGPILARVGASAPDASVRMALAAAALFWLAARIQIAAARSTLLYSPLVAEVTASGNPRTRIAALSLVGLPADAPALAEVLSALSGAEGGAAHATAFLPAAGASSLASSAAALPSLVRAGVEVGLHGEGLASALDSLEIARAADSLAAAVSGSRAAAAAAGSHSSFSLSSSLASLMSLGTHKGGSSAEGSGSSSRSSSASSSGGGGAALTSAGRSALGVNTSFSAADTSVSAPRSTVVWFCPEGARRDVLSVRAANAAGLSVALWSCAPVAAAAAPALPATALAAQVGAAVSSQLHAPGPEALLPAMAPAPTGRAATDTVRAKVAAMLADRRAGACVAIPLSPSSGAASGAGGAAAAAAVRGVVSALGAAGLRLSTLTELCPNAGHVNEVLRIGGGGGGIGGAPARVA